MTPNALLPLHEARNADECGNKAVNLARAMRHGILSSDGFVLSTRAWHENLRRLGIADRVAVALKAGAEAKAERQALVRTICDGGVGDALERAISASLMRGEVYAVRSSAVGEDGATTSFAGQFDSVLGCTSAEAVASAVCRVWASLLNGRALAYSNHSHTVPAAIAVIIQHQVDPVASGVLFTVDPLAHDTGAMIVEYCSGLGDRMDSGEVTPSRGRIDRATGEFSLEWGAEDTAEWTPAQGPAAQALCDLGRNLEEVFGGPQDVEFSVDRDRNLVLLQSRPITARTRAAPMVSWSNANIAENFPDPICEMLRSFVGRGYNAYFRCLAAAFGVPRARIAAESDRLENIVGCHGGRLYYNLSNIHSLLYLVPGGRHLAAYFNTFTGARGLAPPVGSRPTVVREGLELALMPFRVFAQYCLLSRRLAKFENRINGFARESHPRELGAKSPEELARLIEGFLDIRLRHWTPAALSDAAAMISYGLLGSMLRDRPEIDENLLLQGLPGLASAAPVEALWELACDFRQSGAAEHIAMLGVDDVKRHLAAGTMGDLGEKITAYLDEWGFRSSGELLLTQQTPQEDPASVIGLLRAYVQTNDAGPVAKSRMQAEVRKARTRDAVRAMPPAWRPVLRGVLWATQKSIGFRERARMKQALLYSRLRQVTLNAGRGLVQRGDLSRAEDVFHLRLEELVDALRGGALAEEIIDVRKRELRENRSWSPPDAFELSSGEVFTPLHAPRQEAAQEADVRHLRGTTACAGRTEGPAIVALDVSEISSIESGQILVTRQTDPGWAAAFFLVRGLVIERGGLLSHGAIIAREYGIPAIIGVEGATDRIQTGDRLELIADLGEVRF